MSEHSRERPWHTEEIFRSKRPAEMRAMPEGKPPTPLEDAMQRSALRCAILDMVDERMPPAVPTLPTLQP
jgi:hypothetical protein